mgnify:CR=1 FL=1
MVAHDRAADGDTLALSARELAGAALQQRLDLQRARRFQHQFADLRLGQLCLFEAEGHVLVDGHVGVERVALEHHGDAAPGRRLLVHQRAVDQQLALGDGLEPGDHPEHGGFAAAGGADKDDELAILHVETDAVDHLVLAEGFSYIAKGERGHVSAP